MAALAWNRASGSPPRSCTRSTAPSRWSGSADSRPIRYVSASCELNAPTGNSAGLRAAGTAPSAAAVTSTWPAGPAGHSPSRWSGSATSSSTTSHGWLVSASQARNRAATVSPSPTGVIPARSANART